jgi:hypothetical protein
MPTQVTQSMVSETSIANQALSWLGQDPITSLDDRSTTAEWMKNNYPFLRDAVLEERMWTFATVRAMSTAADLDPFGAQYSHVMPLGWSSIFRVYRNTSGADPSRWNKSEGWRREGANILTREETVALWGINRVTDTGPFSLLFVQALAARLAADACIPLTENRQLQSDMFNLYSVKLAEAAVRDGQQGSNELIQSDSLINARWSSGGGLR